MNATRLSLLGLTTLLFFVLGFASSLSLHWRLRPSVEQTSATFSQEELDSELTYGVMEFEKRTRVLRDIVLEKEQTLEEATSARDIDQARARSLNSQIKAYRDDRNQLFTYLEEHKQQLRDKVSSLEDAIKVRMELREQNTPSENEFDQLNRLISLLNYPHALNDNAQLNTALQTSTDSLGFVESRFDLMMAPEQYNLTEKADAQLTTLVEMLNKKHNNATEVTWTHCSNSHCEIQVQMQANTPYYDYWQEWLDVLATNELLKRLESEVSDNASGLVVGSAIVSIF